MENNRLIENQNNTLQATEWGMQIRNMKIAFDTPLGEFVAVKDIHLNVKSGEIVSIIGHSGCGKSTILNAIGGFVKPVKGEILIKGIPVNGPGPDRGFVFQHYSLLPWLTVYKNIYEAVDSVLKKLSKAEKTEITDRYIEAVGLSHHKNKFPSQISGGMKQRVAIARAFAINSDFLLLDEPFGALDALTKGTMHVELLKLWNMDNRNKTIIMVTHDIEEAIFLSDRYNCNEQRARSYYTRNSKCTPRQTKKQKRYRTRTGIHFPARSPHRYAHGQSIYTRLQNDFKK